ncbi:hypothetical protein AAFF_G00098570 [Aldrovandia affinis]|uniref:Uncharacterized protein n=1 Tax=Aldrovandia affinis TaxID=143900 RepID=A0AAD7RVB9_9TELE|nr:hypothetical protein AAFF_G00098570 [Aldrovandia affinis]
MPHPLLSKSGSLAPIDSNRLPHSSPHKEEVPVSAPSVVESIKPSGGHCSAWPAPAVGQPAPRHTSAHADYTHTFLYRSMKEHKEKRQSSARQAPPHQTPRGAAAQLLAVSQSCGPQRGFFRGPTSAPPHGNKAGRPWGPGISL